MDVVAVSVEYILAGMLALSAFLLPFMRNSNPFTNLVSAEGLAIVAFAYLTGVIFDKLADAFLKPFERYLRLKEACKDVDKKMRLDGDPFPQDALEFALREGNNGSLQWMNSLRSRIRCARALAVFGVPSALGLTVYSTAFIGEWPYAVAALSLLLSCAMIALDCKRLRLPKTEEIPDSKNERVRFMGELRKCIVAWCCIAVSVNLVPACSIIVITVEQSRMFGLPSGAVYAIAFGACGVLLAGLSFWAWMSTTNTYLRYLHRKLPDLMHQVERVD